MQSVTRDIPRLMLELLKEVGEEVPPKFTKRAVEIIDEIADYAETTSLFQDAKQRGEETFPKGTKAAQLYGYMLDRIVNAPTALYLNASVILMMPFLRKAVHEEYGQGVENNDREAGENDG